MATIVQPPQQHLRECVLRNGKKIAGASPICFAKESRARVLARTAVLDLPEELLEAILPYLHIKDLCALSQVCSRLNALAVRSLMPRLPGCNVPTSNAICWLRHRSPAMRWILMTS